MSFNNFKSTTIRGSFNNSDHADGSVLASATFQRGLTSSGLITTNGLLNTRYNSIFGNNSFNLLQSQSGGYFYSGSFTEIPIVNLPLNPIIGTTYTFYNAGTFTVLIQCPPNSGFESAGQIVQNGLSPPACVLFQGSNITLYFRGSWVCVAGFSYMPARLNLANTYPLLQTFNNININGVLNLPNNSINDINLSSNVALKNTNNTFTQVNRFNSTSHFNAGVIFGPIVGSAKINIDSFSGNIATIGNISCGQISAAQLSFSNNSILDAYLSSNVVLSSDLNALLSSYNYLTTGDQDITGVKTFLNTIVASDNVSCGLSAMSQDNIASSLIIGTTVRSRFTSFITREIDEIPSINQLGYLQEVTGYHSNIFSPVNQYTSALTVPAGLHLFTVSQVIGNTSTTTATTITSRILGLTTTDSSSVLSILPMYANNTYNTTTIPIGKNLLISATYTIYHHSTRTYYLGSNCIGSGGTTISGLSLYSTRIG